MTAAGAPRPEQVVLLYVTAPAALAERLAEALVAERLAACVNLVPGVVSFYRWEGAVQRDAEVLLLAKTTAGRADAATARLVELHEYTLPCVVRYEAAGGLDAYLRWVADETTPG